MSHISRLFMSYEPTYWRGMVCTLGSLARHAQVPINVEVMMRGEHVHAFYRILKKVPADIFDITSVTPLVMSEAALRECEALRYDAHFKPEICFRLYYFEMSRLVGNAVYLDIDTIVRTSLDELSCFIPQNLPIAARAHEIINPSILKIDSGLRSYFNSGVLLFNLDKMECEIAERLRSSRVIMRNISGASGYLDQDALNLAFKDRWQVLPARFNYMSTDRLPLDRRTGHILHATGSRKPWMLGGRHRFSSEYAEEMAGVGQSVLHRYEAQWIVDRTTRRIANFFGNT